MPLFSDMEKEILQNALSVFLQLNQRQMAAGDFEKLYALSQRLMEKIDSAGEGAGGGPGGRPRGISEEWYEQCCRACQNLSPDGRCLDKITEKYPGKCDPILRYERGKLLKKNGG
jgi:hypothetical protein